MANNRRVTIGRDSLEALRRLSDGRALTCPACKATVVLKAGTIRAAHFAHLPGATCSLPQTEPETQEHRAGKLLLAQWLQARLPEAEVQLEAYLPETGQRADLLLLLPLPAQAPRRIALEYQCANLSAREWKRRHTLYQNANIQDLWLLGGSRLKIPPPDTRHPTPNTLLHTTELERTLLREGAPLLFLDSVGEHLAIGTLARFRPDQDTQSLQPTGKLSAKPLLTLDFPFHLLDWHSKPPSYPVASPSTPDTRHPTPHSPTSEAWLWEWLAQHFRVTPETLTEFFGWEVTGQEVIACEGRAWQAAIYYRFIHQQVGEGWWLAEVEKWARAYLPLVHPANPSKLHRALLHYQEIMAAAGFLSLPMGYGRTNARIVADLTTLTTPPNRAEVLRLARYRRTLTRRQ